MRSTKQVLLWFNNKMATNVQNNFYSSKRMLVYAFFFGGEIFLEIFQKMFFIYYISITNQAQKFK